MKTQALFVLMSLCATAAPDAQQARFDDVVRNLRNPDAKVRLGAVRLLREARYPEAILPMAALVNDPVDQIQLEAIAAELAFFLVRPVPERRRLGGIVEVRNRGGAPAAFELGALGVWPRRAPAELMEALLKAVDDENPRVRVEAVYAAGVVGGGAVSAATEQALIRALDHYDPAIRAGAARVAGRLRAKGPADALYKSMNDSHGDVRNAAMWALGELRDERALQALAEQLKFHNKGKGAWYALDALAKIGHASSMPLFRSRLADRDPALRCAAAEGVGRSGDASAIPTLETTAGSDGSEAVRAASAFALQKLGRNYVARIVSSLDDGRMAPQIQGYLLELGPAIEQELIPELKNPDPAIRAGVADVLGEIGGDASLAALQAAQDRDERVTEAVVRALQRMKIRKE